MTENSATITFHSPDFVDFDPTDLDDVEFIETETGCTFKVPVEKHASVDLESSRGRSIQATLEAFSIRLTRPAVPLVNGKPQDLSYILQPGDEIMMLFQISGG